MTLVVQLMTKPEALRAHRKMKKGLESFQKLSNSISPVFLEFRHREGFRALGFESFEKYVAHHFPDWNRSTVFRALNHAELALETPELADVPQSHSRALAIVPAAARIEVYEQAAEAAGGQENLTAEHVQAAAEQYTRENPEQVITNYAGGVTTAESSAKPGGGPIGRTSADSGADDTSAPDDEERTAAIHRIGKLYGKAAEKALKTGSVAIPRNELLWMAALSDEDLEKIQALVMNNRWMPKRALKFLNQMPDENDRVSDLINRALSAPDGKSKAFTGTFNGAMVVIVTDPDDRMALAKWADKNLSL